MRILLLIALLFVGIIEAKPRESKQDLRRKIDNLTNLLGSQIADSCETDTIYLMQITNPAEVVKGSQKTIRKQSKHELKASKNDNKLELKTNVTRLWTKVINKTFTKVFLGLSLILIGRKSKELLGPTWPF